MSTCTWRKKTTDHGTINQQKQFEKLIEVIDKHHLVQMIEEPMREENTLDLIFTNNPEIITQLDISKTIMSDHNIIEVTTNLKDCDELTSNNDETTEIDETDLRQLNFHHKNVSWDKIKEMIKEMS